jgi:hypothetical protein
MGDVTWSLSSLSYNQLTDGGGSGSLKRKRMLDRDVEAPTASSIPDKRVATGKALR